METAHKLFKCDLCKYHTKQKQHLRRHKLNKHSLNIVKCDHCNRKFSSKDLLNEHIEIDHKPLSCCFCDFYARNRQALMKHINEKHNIQSVHVMKRKTSKNDQEETSFKRSKSSNQPIDIQQNEDNMSSSLTSDNDMNCNQVEDEPNVGASHNNSQDSDSMLKINNSFPNINNHCAHLVEYRVKLLTVEATTLCRGESKVVNTNCQIEDDLKLCMYLKANKELNLLFQEVFILPQKQTVTVTLTNIDEEVKIIPEQFCVGYLIITHPKQ